MPERIEGSRLDQAFDHPFIDDTQIHLLAELENRLEIALPLSRVKNRANGVFANILDGKESEAISIQRV
jgi:hypothetical protein